MAFELKIDNEIILLISDTEEKIVKNSVSCYKEWIKTGVLNIIKEKIDNSMKRLEQEWIADGKLAANGVVSIPLDRNEKAELIFSQPNYKDKNARDANNAAQ